MLCARVRACLLAYLHGQVCNIAFAKTHKTASTTMAMILVRYARRHDKKVIKFPKVLAYSLGHGRCIAYMTFEGLMVITVVMGW